MDFKDTASFTSFPVQQTLLVFNDNSEGALLSTGKKVLRKAGVPGLASELRGCQVPETVSAGEKRPRPHSPAEFNIYPVLRDMPGQVGVVAFSEASTFGCTPAINYPEAYKKNLSPNPSQAF